MSARGGCNHCFTLCSSLFVNLFAKVMLNLQECRSLLSIGGIICNFTQFCPIFNIRGDKPQPRFFSGEQIKQRPKKRSSPKMEHFFFPEFKWTPTFRCTPESNYWRGCRCRPYSNYWGDTVKLLGQIYPPPPRVSAPLLICDDL